MSSNGNSSDATPTILVVDDDRSMRASLVDLLSSAGWRVEALARADQVADRLGGLHPDVILSDVRMPGMSGLDLLVSLSSELAPPLVLISAHGDIPMAVQAMQAGAYSFLEKPYEPRRLLTVLRHAADQHRMRAGAERLKARLARLSGLDRILMGRTDETARLREDVLDLAETGTPVLIRGETGTGKDLVARALHDLGPRPDGPFVALNCAALPAGTFESEMFGVAGGYAGKLVAADGGTLFLDEICACPMPVQAKLLRVLEEQLVTPLGGTEAIAVRFRVVSSTSADPEREVAEGRLRADLLFRLNTVMLTLPPLRQRRDDILLLFTHFVDYQAGLYEIAAPELSQTDIAALLAHDWPGNVRELRNVAERRLLAARRGGGSVAQAIRADAGTEDLPDTLREAVAAVERELIGKAIRAHQGRMDAVAEALGIGRRTLNEKIVKLGLDKDALL